MRLKILLIVLVMSCFLRAQPVRPAAASAVAGADVAHVQLDALTVQEVKAQSSETTQPGLRLESLIPFRETAGTLFENVVSVLRAKYYDQGFRSETLPRLVSEYSARANRAQTLAEQRAVVHDFLSHIPSSHLGLLSKRTFQCFTSDLQGRPYPTFGFQLQNLQGKFYAYSVLEGGPAARAGLLSWDRIVKIDGLPVERSPRLDWRSDDAFIPDDRDPPVHHLIADRGDAIQLDVERKPGKHLKITINADQYSSFAAAKVSARVIRSGNRSFGYLHFWFIHMSGVPELLKQTLEADFANCDGLILDLRGRGGNGNALAPLLQTLREERSARNRPIVALFDRQSRSAKDVLAYELKRTGLARIVGEKTAGAVIPATFADVGHDSVLMFPSFKLGRYTDLLEHKGVEPDLFVERARPFSAGRDPILEAGLAELRRMVGEVRIADFGFRFGDLLWAMPAARLGSWYPVMPQQRPREV
jgi:carboxyl-terminal processing protease